MFRNYTFELLSLSEKTMDLTFKPILDDYISLISLFLPPCPLVFLSLSLFPGVGG